MTTEEWSDIPCYNIEDPHEQLLTAMKIEVKYEINGWKMKRYKWIGPSKEEANVQIGDRVWPAGEKFNDYFFVKDIKQPGTKYYPDGGYVCQTGYGATRSFELDAIIKHPGKQELEEKTKRK